MVPYALSQCTESEGDAVETHLLGCDLCFEDLRVLDRAGEILAEHLGPAGKPGERVRRLMDSGVGAQRPTGAHASASDAPHVHEPH